MNGRQKIESALAWCLAKQLIWQHATLNSFYGKSSKSGNTFSKPSVAMRQRADMAARAAA